MKTSCDTVAQPVLCRYPLKLPEQFVSPQIQVPSLTGAINS